MTQTRSGEGMDGKMGGHGWKYVGVHDIRMERGSRYPSSIVSRVYCSSCSTMMGAAEASNGEYHTGLRYLPSCSSTLTAPLLKTGRRTGSATSEVLESLTPSSKTFFVAGWRKTEERRAHSYLGSMQSDARSFSRAVFCHSASRHPTPRRAPEAGGHNHPAQAKAFHLDTAA